MEKIFRKLSDLKGRSVSLYRSTDMHNTGIYFTDYGTQDRKTISAFFEVLVFKYEYDKKEFYIRFPNTDYFVELNSSGCSARWDMKKTALTNVWGDTYGTEMEVLTHDSNMIILFGKYSGHNFNFLQMVARSTKDIDESFNRDSSLPNSFGRDEIEKVFDLEYVRIPEEIRSIPYMYIYRNSVIVVDVSTYYFTYKGHRFRTVDLISKEVKELKTIKFDRYRDGGTTEALLCELDDSSVEYKFFHPTSFGNHGKKPTFCGEEIFPVEKEKPLYDEMVKLLEIKLNIEEK